MSNDMNVSVVIQALDKFTAPVKKIASVSDGMAKKLAETQQALSTMQQTSAKIDAFRRMKKTAEQSKAALHALQAEAQQAGKRMAEARRKVADLEKALLKETYTSGQNIAEKKRLNRELKAAQKELAGVERASKRLAGQVRRSSAAYNDEQRLLNTLRSELSSTGVDTKKLAHAQRKLKQDMTAATQKMEQQAIMAEKLARRDEMLEKRIQTAANLSFVADAASRTGQSIKTALEGPLSAAISMESAMAAVAKTTGIGKQGMAAFSAQLDELAKRLPVAKTGLAKIAATGGQLGVAKKDLIPFTETVAKMSTAFDMVPDAAADAIGKLSNLYGIPIRQIGKLGDTINELSNNSPARAGEIVDALKRVGGVARQFGLTADQAAALSGAFIAMGSAPEVAGTAINSLLQKLQTADKQGDKFKKALAAIGLSADGMATAVQQDAQGALSGLLEQLAGLDAQQRAGVLVDLFGTEFSDDIGKLVGSLGVYKKQLIIASNKAATAGSMEREFQTQAGTTANNLQLLQNRWDALKVGIGDRLIPVLEAVIPKVEWLIDSVGGIIKKFPGATTTVLAVTAAVGGIALAVAPVLTAIAALIGALAFLRKSAAGTALSIAAGGIGGKGGMLKKLAGVAMGLVGNLGLPGKLLAAIPAAYAISSQVDMGGRLYDWLHNNQQAKPGPALLPAQQKNIHQDNRATYHVTVNAHGGDPTQLRDAVQQALADHQQQQAATMRGALFDF